MNGNKVPGAPSTALDAKIKEALETLRYISKQLQTMSNDYFLALLREFTDRPFMNADASALFKTKRQTTWVRLKKMVELGLLEKRGHVYRVSPFSRRFVLALSNVTQALILGKDFVYDDESAKLLLMARDGVESLYARGRITQENYVWFRRRLEELIPEHAASSQ
jgi:hypothetical protein